MSADDRTPDTREARSMYCAGSNLYRETPEQHYLGAPAPDYGAEFDRFLARVRRDAAREALDGLAEDVRGDWRREHDWIAQPIEEYRDTHYPKETP